MYVNHIAPTFLSLKTMTLFSTFIALMIWTFWANISKWENYKEKLCKEDSAGF